MIIVNVSEEYYEKVKEKTALEKISAGAGFIHAGTRGGLLPINTFNK